MVSKTARVSARVPEELVRKLEGIMDSEGIYSMSECLRDCIEEYVKLKTTPFSTEKILLDVGKDVIEDIDNLVDIGRVSGRTEAFRHAIKTWTESEVDKYLLKRKKYSEAVSEAKSKILDTRGQRSLTTYYERP